MRYAPVVSCVCLQSFKWKEVQKPRDMCLAWAPPYILVGFIASNYLCTSTSKYVKNTNIKQFFCLLLFSQEVPRELVLSSMRWESLKKLASRIINPVVGTWNSDRLRTENNLDILTSEWKFDNSFCKFHRVGDSSLPEQQDVSVPSPAGMSKKLLLSQTSHHLPFWHQHRQPIQHSCRDQATSGATARLNINQIKHTL